MGDGEESPANSPSAGSQVTGSPGFFPVLFLLYSCEFPLKNV